MKRKNANWEASTSSKRNSKGCGDEEQEEVQIDRISDLPDSVLAHILSFLPTQDAVKTLLLRRFGFLWATCDNLCFDYRSFPDEVHEHCYNEDYGPRCKRFKNFVRHVLTLRERNPIHCFRLKFEFLMRYSTDEDLLEDPGGQKLIKRELRLANEINTWTRFAIRREVKVLDLDFLACWDIDTDSDSDIDEPETETLYKIPDFVFNCDSIRELKLVDCKVEPRGLILMRSLLTFFLKHVALDSTKIDEILSGFPLLENLSLIECYNLRKLNFVPPNLKYLKFVGICSDSKLEIYGPNITSLEVSGSVEQVGLKNLSSLMDATLGIKCYHHKDEDRYHEVRKILENLNHAKILTICEEPILFWFTWALIKISLPPTAWKHIILRTRVSSGLYLPEIASLLRTSPCLEILDIHMDGPLTYYPFTRFALRLEIENYWSKLEESCQGLPNNLQTVRIYGLVAEPCVLELLQFLLKNLVGLEKMVITSKRSNGSNQERGFTSDELLELSQKLHSFPRASSNAVICFPEL